MCNMNRTNLSVLVWLATHKNREVSIGYEEGCPLVLYKD